MDTYNIALLLALGALLFVLSVFTRLHQRKHCAHLHALSAAVVALASQMEPGVLPEDVADFLAWYGAPEHKDEYVDDDAEVEVKTS